MAILYYEMISAEPAEQKALLDSWSQTNSLVNRVYRNETTFIKELKDIIELNPWKNEVSIETRQRVEEFERVVGPIEVITVDKNVIGGLILGGVGGVVFAGIFGGRATDNYMTKRRIEESSPEYEQTRRGFLGEYIVKRGLLGSLLGAGGGFLITSAEAKRYYNKICHLDNIVSELRQSK